MRILIFQHLAIEHPGVFLDFWRDAGHTWHTVELDTGEPIPPLEPFDLLAVMGGPMDVWEENLYPWIGPEKQAIRRWVQELNRPYLGICLGHQLLAEALGGRVGLMSQPEVGVETVRLTATGIEDMVFRGIGPDIAALQWHGAEVSELPNGATILASSPACPVQAFRWGRHAYGVQFHIEVMDSTTAGWQAIPEYKASLERVLGPAGATALAADVAQNLPRFNAAARTLNDNLMSLIAASGVP